MRKEDLVDQKLNCSFELPSSLSSSLGVLSAVAESPPLLRTAQSKPDGRSASPALVGVPGNSSGSEFGGDSLHRSELERSLEASTRYSDLGEEASERDVVSSGREQSAGGRDVEKELMEKLQLERRHAGATAWAFVIFSHSAPRLTALCLVCCWDALPQRWDVRRRGRPWRYGCRAAGQRAAGSFCALLLYSVPWWRSCHIALSSPFGRRPRSGRRTSYGRWGHGVPALGGAPFRWRGGDLPLSSPKARGAGSPSCRAPPRRALPGRRLGAWLRVALACARECGPDALQRKQSSV